MRRYLKVIFISATVAIAIFLTWQSYTPAQSVANLQADIYNLRSQVNQLQAQVVQLSGQRSTARPSSGTPQRTQPGYPYISDRDMLDRLATLAIEAKDRMNALEARVSRLEKKL